MSALATEHAAVEVTVHDGDRAVWLRFTGALLVRNSAAIRRTIAEHLDLVGTGRRLVVDLGDVSELDAAGLAAVTAPMFSARRQRRDVVVLGPTDGQARRLVDRVGVLPIGRI